MNKLLKQISYSLLNFRNKIELKRAKRVLKTLKMCESLIQYNLRFKHKNKKFDELGEQKDTLISLTVTKLCDLKYDKQQYEEFERANEKAIENEIQTALKDSEIRSWLAIRFELSAFISKLIEHEDEYNISREKAKTFDINTIQITINNLRNIEYLIRSRLKFFKSLVDEQDKISLSATQLVAGITLVSTVFIVTGYLYINYFLSSFGVNVSLYFSLTDYLASSIENIQSVAVSAIVGTISVLFGYP